MKLSIIFLALVAGVLANPANNGAAKKHKAKRWATTSSIATHSHSVATPPHSVAVHQNWVTYSASHSQARPPATHSQAVHQNWVTHSASHSNSYSAPHPTTTPKATSTPEPISTIKASTGGLQGSGYVVNGDVTTSTSKTTTQTLSSSAITATYASQTGNGAVSGNSGPAVAGLLGLAAAIVAL